MGPCLENRGRTSLPPRRPRHRQAGCRLRKPVSQGEACLDRMSDDNLYGSEIVPDQVFLCSRYERRNRLCFAPRVG